ncbi:FimD/PapC C-terminal domain-containing protein [Budvicia aquatica]|nr:FimD/PapC C-terminal domain-containing protein [Budvicia aquatica]
MGLVGQGNQIYARTAGTQGQLRVKWATLSVNSVP